MNIVVQGMHGSISSVLDSKGKLKEWQEWSSSFDHILENDKSCCIFQWRGRCVNIL